MLSGCCKYLKSSIVKKQIMAVTGLMLCGFLVVHLAGNFLIFVGAKAFNSYAHALITSPILYPAEAILLLLFLSHIYMAIRLTIENKIARGQSYAVKKATGRGATLASSTMPYTGLITLIFLIFHLWHIKFGAEYRVVYNNVDMRDLFRLLLEYFSSIWVTAWYVFAHICLGFHVAHGFWSAFQSLGINNTNHSACLKKLGMVFGVIIAVGFSSVAIYLYLQGGGANV